MYFYTVLSLRVALDFRANSTRRKCKGPLRLRSIDETLTWYAPLCLDET